MLSTVVVLVNYLITNDLGGSCRSLKRTNGIARLNRGDNPCHFDSCGDAYVEFCDIAAVREVSDFRPINSPKSTQTALSRRTRGKSIYLLSYPGIANKLARMYRLESIKRCLLIALITLLGIAMASGQGMRFHVHDLDHANEFVTTIAGHAHTASLHWSIDMSHADHHDGAPHEIASLYDNLAPPSLLQLPAPELLILLAFILLSSALYRQAGTLTRDCGSPVRRRSYFIPLLRAPPR